MDPSPASPLPPEQVKALAAEKRIAVVRLAVILFNVAVYYTLLPRSQGIPWLADAISAVATAYGFYVILAQPYRRWPIMRAALFTALTDGVLIALWVAATGGIESPFHLLWLLSMMAVAFRYDSKATVVATVLYVASYVALLALEGSLLANGTEALVRCTYIVLAGTLGALLARDSAAVFEEQANAERALAEERRQHEVRELERLRDLNRFKTDFINAAAHELNTPLTPLRLQVHLLEKLGGQEDPAVRQRAVRILGRNVERLGLLVSDMLDVARLQSGRLRIERLPVDVSTLVADAVETFRGPAGSKDMTVHVDGPASLVAHLDGKRVSQILYNLISNAIKYSPAATRVQVRFGGDERQVTLEVADQGLGFSQEQRDLMFAPFSQAHRDLVSAPGTGLGLFISRGIAERHGGTLDGVSPGPGKGATFTCVLPNGHEAPAPSDPQASSQPPA